MPDLQQFSIERGDATNVVSPTHIINGQLVEGETLIHDFTGSNAIRWPQILATLTVEQQDAIVDRVKMDLINYVAGIG